MSTTLAEKPHRSPRAGSFLRRSSIGPLTHIHFDDPDETLALSLPSSGGRSMISQRKKVFRPTTSLWTSVPLIGSDSGEASPKRSGLSFGSESSVPASPSADGSGDGRHSVLSASGDGEMERHGSQNRSQRMRRANRPSSIFGSLRNLRMSDSKDEDGTTTPPATAGSGRTPSSTWSLFGDEKTDIGRNRNVLHHGEAQTETGVFWKKKQYFVLTETHLVRFKNQSKASEVFPSVPSQQPHSRAKRLRHISSNSTGSANDAESDISGDGAVGIPVEQIVAVYQPDEGRTFFSLEISHLDPDAGQGSSIIMQFSDSEDRDLWSRSIRYVANKARLIDVDPISPKLSEYAARAVEREQDYDVTSYRIYKVVKRTSLKSSSRSLVEEGTKSSSTPCFLVIGQYKVHIIPLPKNAFRVSSPSLAELSEENSFGLLTMTEIFISEIDDRFSIEFRSPFKKRKKIRLASLAGAEIALQLRHRETHLRPEWTRRPYNFKVPATIDEKFLLEEISQGEDHNGFDRTLIAHCVAYDVNPSAIRYTINYSVEDGPKFELLEPAYPHSIHYSSLELIAIMRSLRYNESFGSISFARTSLDVLNCAYDNHGAEHICTHNRFGDPIKITLEQQQRCSVLIQEIRALAIASKRLRRMDFSYSIGFGEPKSVESITASSLPSCGLIEALCPLCKDQTTNVDWITLNGIELGETDLEYLINMAAEKDCHFRAIEASRCGLTDRGMALLLEALRAQVNTLEALDISYNTLRLVPSILSRQLDSLCYVRKLDLSGLACTGVAEPLLPLEILSLWRLEDLRLSGIALNEQTIQAICGYLASPRSHLLRELILSNCSLTGKHVADMMQSMTQEPGTARFLHLNVSENRLQEQHNRMTSAIARSLAPTHFSMRSVEYDIDDMYQDLLLSFAKNNSIRYLDMAKVSLPAEANEETCKALEHFLATNETLEDLDISGEDSRLEVSKFGVGINQALNGLKRNTSLQILRIQSQKLGLQGASTLSDVLKENSTLRQLHCESNAITLSGFTDLVNALASNTTLLYLPSLEEGRDAALRQTEQQIKIARTKADGSAMANPSPNSNKISAMRKTLASFPGSPAKPSTPRVAAVPRWTEQDVQAALRLVSEGWEGQANRLAQFLERNWAIHQGGSLEDGDLQQHFQVQRPDPAESISKFMQTVASESTPTVEKQVKLGDELEHSVSGLLGDLSFESSPMYDDAWKVVGLDEGLSASS